MIAAVDTNTIGAFHAGAGDTERAAALEQAAKSGTDRRRVYDALLRLGPMTDHELAEATGLYLYTAAPRRCELRDAGLVVDTGLRRPTPNRKSAAVWGLCP